MTYTELKNIQYTWKGKVCLFGAGLIGCTWGYNIIKTIGFNIDYYCDNNKKENTIIKNGIRIIPLQKLYSFKENVLIFITVIDKNQEAIKEQLKENGIVNIVEMDNYFLQTFCESLFEINDKDLNEKYKFILDDEEFLKMLFEERLGYALDLENPLTYNEKLQWLKLYDREKAYNRLVDKYEVKKYIGRYVGEEYVVPTLGVWNNFSEIDFDLLPNQFVLKCTHDSGTVIICKNKELLNINKTEKILENALQRNWYWCRREWVYKDVRPRIMAEKYLEDSQDGELRDYKLFCFHGCVKALLIATGRMGIGEAKTDFFDAELNHINMRSGHPNSEVPPHLPINYLKMKEAAENISSKIPHLRVDFYEVNGRVYIGELTFCHQSGMVALEPWEKDLEWGGWIHLDKVPGGGHDL